MRIARSPFALALLLALPACGGAAADGKGAAAPAAGTPEKLGDMTLEVVSAGDGDARALRYALSTTQRETMTMDMKMSIQVTAPNGKSPAIDMPLVRMKMRLDPKRAVGDGSVAYAYELTSVELVDDPKAKSPPELSKALSTELKKLQGMHGEMEISSRGVASKATMEVAPDVGDEIRDMVDQSLNALKDLSLPLPAQPVARGAKWRTVSPIHMKSIEATRTVDSTLQALDGNHATLHQVVVVSAKPQQVQNKKLPAGAKLMLDSMDAEGEGNVDIDLTHLVPTSAAEIDGTAKMTIEAGSEKQAMSVSTRVDIHVAPDSAK